MRAKSVSGLIKEGARQLQEVMQLQGKQVELLRAVAETVVQLRLRMDDIAGRSQEASLRSWTNSNALLCVRIACACGSLSMVTRP